MLARLLYGAAIILAFLGLLGLLKVFVIGVGWVALFVAAVICFIVANVLVGRRTPL